MSWWDSGDSGSSDGGSSTDWWGAILSGISAYSQGKDRGKDADRAGQWGLRAIQETGAQSRRNSAYESGLADFYRRSLQQERRQGFSNFGQFSRNQYNQTYTPPPVGAAPSPDMYDQPADIPMPKTSGGLAGLASRG
jgi:hypothetical protein